MFKKQTSYIFIMICTMLCGVSAAPGVRGGAAPTPAGGSPTHYPDIPLNLKAWLIISWQHEEFEVYTEEKERALWEGYSYDEVCPVPGWAEEALKHNGGRYMPSENILSQILKATNSTIERLEWIDNPATKLEEATKNMLSSIDSIRLELQENYMLCGDIIENICEWFYGDPAYKVKNEKRLTTNLQNHIAEIRKNFDSLVKAIREVPTPTPTPRSTWGW